jgi:hypothetical protein
MDGADRKGLYPAVAIPSDVPEWKEDIPEEGDLVGNRKTNEEPIIPPTED